MLSGGLLREAPRHVHAAPPGRGARGRGERDRAHRSYSRHQEYTSFSNFLSWLFNLGCTSVGEFSFCSFGIFYVVILKAFEVLSIEYF